TEGKKGREKERKDGRVGETEGKRRGEREKKEGRKEGRKEGWERQKERGEGEKRRKKERERKEGWERQKEREGKREKEREKEKGRKEGGRDRRKEKGRERKKGREGGRERQKERGERERKEKKGGRDRRKKDREGKKERRRREEETERGGERERKRKKGKKKERKKGKGEKLEGGKPERDFINAVKTLVSQSSRSRQGKALFLGERQERAWLKLSSLCRGWTASSPSDLLLCLPILAKRREFAAQPRISRGSSSRASSWTLNWPDGLQCRSQAPLKAGQANGGSPSRSRKSGGGKFSFVGGLSRSLAFMESFLVCIPAPALLPTLVGKNDGVCSPAHLKPARPVRCLDPSSGESINPGRSGNQSLAACK
ncbi:RNA-binding protein 25, partial [Ophiophagus hannah]